MKTLIETTPVAEMTISNVTPAAQARHLPTPVHSGPPVGTLGAPGRLYLSRTRLPKNQCRPAVLLDPALEAKAARRERVANWSCLMVQQA